MVTARTVLTDQKFPTKISRNFFINGKQPTLGAKGFSCAVSGFGQVLKSDTREKPLDLSSPFASTEPITTPLIPKHPESGCFANWFSGDIECFKRSDWITITIGA